jgi:pimeloyl-ACP methyl ester carboxylesterase
MKFVKRLFKAALVAVVVLVAATFALFGYRDRTVEELSPKYAQPPSAFMQVESTSAHYRDEGTSTERLPIVLLHGTSSSLHTFDAWAERLSTQRRVLRVDLPGFGLTGPFPDRDYSIQHYVHWLHAFLQQSNVTHFVLVGNSLGGNIAWNYVARYPDSVDKLILIDSSRYPIAAQSTPLAFRLAQTPVLKHGLKWITPRFMAQSSVINVYADSSKVTDPLIDRYFELTLRAGNRQALGDRFKSQSPPDTSLIKAIQQPTLILWGAQDRLTPLELAHRFHEDLPNSQLVVLENTGHVPMEESPQESLQAVLSFLGSP